MVEFLANYSGVNFHTINFPGQNVGKKFIPGGDKIFWMGINKVTAAEYEKLKDDPSFLHLLESGKILWVEGHGPEDATDRKGDFEGASIAKSPEAEAKRLVAKTFDVELLKEWKATEKRKAVIEALEGQIDKVTKVVPAKKKE